MNQNHDSSCSCSYQQDMYGKHTNYSENVEMHNILNELPDKSVANTTNLVMDASNNTIGDPLSNYGGGCPNIVQYNN